MGWKTAVQHYHQWDPDPSSWKLLDEADTATVKETEKTKDPLSQTSDSVCCTRCRHKTYKSSISVHLKNEHGVEQISNDDYCQPLDTPFWGDKIRLLPLSEFGSSLITALDSNQSS